MARLCSAKDCQETATIVEPLQFDELVLHVPLCPAHDTTWKEFATKREKALRRLAKQATEAGWVFDLALAYAAFPPHDH